MRIRDRLPRLADERTLPASTATPYRMLAGLLLLVAVLSAMLALASDPGDQLRNVDIAAALVLPALSVVSLRVLPSLRSGVGVDLACLAFSSIACVGVALSTNAASQVLVGLGLVLIAVFAAYFLPPYRFLLQLGVMLVGYAVTTALNPLLLTPVVAFVVICVVATLSLTVASLVRRLRRAALVDPLTGVHNRLALFHLAELLHSAAIRAGVPVSVGVIDLDGLKPVNDRLGHAAGDALIREVARAWQDSLRESDVLARIGGDEFALILPGTDEQHAAELADRVRDRSSGAWSAGFATWAADEELDDALHRADTAMYQVKAERRTGGANAPDGV
jgi:diguanylate cyclase (GGDEF)-like protein